MQAAGSLRVLAIIDEREPEFLALKGGAPTGFDLEILQAFAKSERLELKVVPITAWEALVPALLDQKGDLIAGRFTASRRAPQAAWRFTRGSVPHPHGAGDPPPASGRHQPGRPGAREGRDHPRHQHGGDRSPPPVSPWPGWTSRWSRAR